MICSNCGSEIKEGSLFCGNCGQKLEGAPIVEQSEAIAGQQPIKTEKIKKKKGKSVLKWLLILVILAAGIVGVLFFIESQKKIEVDLAGIVSFEVEGYSGYATATLRIDQEALEDKYEDILYKHAEIKMSSFIKRTDLLEYEVTSLDGLSNGDKIVLSWESDVEKALEEYKVNIICTDVEYVVNGLQELEKINPFDMITVQFDGISGKATATTMMESAPEYMYYFPYYMDRYDQLSNGDTVTITFDDSARDIIAVDYGVMLSETQKSYQVSGLPEYILSSDQMLLEEVDSLMYSAEMHFKNYINDEWSEAASIKNLECIGYFISKADNGYSEIKNAIGLIYEVTANLYYEGRSEDFVYYYPVVFPNVILMPDDSFDYNTHEISRTSNSFQHGFTPIDENDINVPTKTWSYYGFESKDELLQAYMSYSLDYESLSTIVVEEVDYTKQLNGYNAEEQKKQKEEIKAADAGDVLENAVDVFLESTADWSDSVSINSIKCVETVLGTGDVLSSVFDKYVYVVVLEVNTRMEYGGMSEEFTYYYPVKYQSVDLGINSMVSAGPNHYVTTHVFEKMLGDHEIWEAWQVKPSNVWNFYGYETLDEVHAQIEEIRQEHVYYEGEVIPYNSKPEEDATGSLTDAWQNADASEVTQKAEEVFRSTTESWLETATINSVEVADTFIGVADIPAGRDNSGTLFGVLLKINAHVVCDDKAEDFDYYYCVVYDNAVVRDDGTVWVDESTLQASTNTFKKMLGEREIWKAWHTYASNVWIFTGYATLEEAMSDITAIKYNHLRYAMEVIPKENE